jgi:phenylacetate-CoA ligase
MISNKKNIRSTIFWSIDKLKSNVVRKHYDDIKFHYFNSTDESSVNIRQGYLHALIRHVTLNVPFYKNYHNVTELSDLPVVNKLTIINDYDSFISQLHSRGEMIATTTSGSTGTPFTILKDRNKISRHQAENIFFSDLADYPLGSRLYYTRVWNNINKKTIIEKLKTNIVPIDISNLSNESLNTFIQKIESEKQPMTILGFASFFEALARYIDLNSVKSKYHFRTNSIITISEALPDYARLILREFFKCAVFSRYSNMENGFIGQQNQSVKNGYLLNHGSMHVEILSLDSDAPVSLGKLGRIVITDYFNYGMPLVRYDTGDLGILEYDNKFGAYLSKVEGRRTDFIFNTKGELLSPHVITNTMWNFKDLSQFQFIQVDKAYYKIKLNYSLGFYPNEDFLVSSLKSFLGQDARVEVEYVSEIPLLSSGKRSKIVNLMPK